MAAAGLGGSFSGREVDKRYRFFKEGEEAHRQPLTTTAAWGTDRSNPAQNHRTDRATGTSVISGSGVTDINRVHCFLNEPSPSKTNVTENGVSLIIQISHKCKHKCNPL